MAFIVKDTTTAEEIAAAIAAGESVIMPTIDVDAMQAEAEAVRVKSIRTISRCFGIVVGIGLGLAIAPVLIKLLDRE